MTDLAIWTAAIAAAFAFGMLAQAMRESRRPIAAGSDRPEDNGYVPTIDEERA